MSERGVEVDHATVDRWVVKFIPLLLKAARIHGTAVDRSWRLDETYIKVRDARRRSVPWYAVRPWAWPDRVEALAGANLVDE